MVLELINKIYVCHYKKLTDRVDILQEQLNMYDLHAEWITEYDKEEISVKDLESILPLYNSDFTLFNIKRKLKEAEISIMLKHYYIWKNIVLNNIENTLILEDDALFDNDFVNRFNLYIKDVNSDYDFIWVGSCCNLHTKITDSHLIKVNQSRCAHGYIISLKCAKILLEEIKYNNYPVDFFFNKIIIDKNLLSYWMEPDLISQNPIFLTSIQN